MLQDLTDNPTRFLFFTGKGGVGKTSLACAVSVALADAGRKVLLISTDPASNLDEVLETDLSDTPRPVTAVPHLAAMNINPNAAAIAYRERIVGPCRGVLPAAAVARIEEQLSGACTTEIASFNEFSRLIGDESAVTGFDHVVLDTAPTGHTLRLLNLPAAWSNFIASNETGSSCLGPLSGLTDQKETYDRALSVLTNPDTTTLVLVARAETSSLVEAARAGVELRTIGIRHQRLVVNAVFESADSADPVSRHLRDETEAALARIPAGLDTLPRTLIPFRPSGSVGIKRLRSFIHPEFRDHEPATAEPPEHDLDIAGLDELVTELGAPGHGVIMTMGKGGVGKTSVATEVALRLADQGHHVLLATTDPADHLTGRVTKPPANLTIEAIDPHRETQRHVRQVMETTGSQLDPEARALLEEELRSPCIEEIAVFTAFARVVARGSDQFVVLDTAPTGHTLLLLDTTEAYHREVARNAGNLSAEVRHLLPRLRDPDYTKILLVTLPEATPVHEAVALRDDLRRAGIEPHAWILNRSFQTLATTDPLLQAKQADERPYVREVQQLAAKVTLIPLQLSAEHVTAADA